MEIEGPFCRAASYCLFFCIIKNTGWSLSLIPCKEPLNPWNFPSPSERTVVVFHDRSLNRFKMGTSSAGGVGNGNPLQYSSLENPMD